MKLVYIAGPYTHPDPGANTHEALRVADDLADVCAPLVPHLSHFWHAMSPKPYAFWLELDLEYLRRCDALFRIPGESPGADAEVAKADEWGIPVFRSEGGLRFWLGVSA